MSHVLRLPVEALRSPYFGSHLPGSADPRPPAGSSQAPGPPRPRRPRPARGASPPPGAAGSWLLRAARFRWGPGVSWRPAPARSPPSAAARMQVERGARGGRGRRPGRDRPGGERDRERAGSSAAGTRGGYGDGGGRRGRGRAFRGGRGGRGGAPRGGRRDPAGRGGGPSGPVEDDSDAETYGEENEEQGNYSKRKIVSNWDRYRDSEKEVDNESGESQRGTDFSVLLSSAGDSFSQFRFAEEKEWDSEASSPKQNSAFYVDSESLVRALQELPLSLRLNVAAELIQSTVPLELPQVKPKRPDDSKGLGMQLKGPLVPGGKGSFSELKSATATSPRPQGPSAGSQKPAEFMADPLEEELDRLLNLDAPPTNEEDDFLGKPSHELKSEEEEETAQDEKVLAKPSGTEETNVQSEQASTSKNVTEEELEDWLDSMIS
ncbi:cell death regulator Aven [Ochotona princeps]|uniref:cell death regulator Aven n=1 Tax=Ochotona princeps TaxID=9978 RepID=UPI0027151035|nr:cell death regulator Aven [Ochotona princeps]